MERKTILQRKIGLLPFNTVVRSEPHTKGDYVAETEFNGTKYYARGNSERQATQALRQQMEGVTKEDKLKLRS